MHVPASASGRRLPAKRCFIRLILSEDRISLRVFRRVIDELPLQLETRIELEVSGKPREEVLGRLLLTDFVPRQFDTPLPARIEADGRLRLQLRPGQWQLRLLAHRSGPVSELTLDAAPDAPWADDEIWVFDAVPALRQVRVEGVPAIDPNQTSLPMEWRSLPAYRLQAGDSLRLAELRRGDPQPSPNRLHLERLLWLDFDGRGFTVEDRLRGELNRDWRLTAHPQLALGSLELNGEPQVITHFHDSLGVEVRQGQLQSLALSRLEQAGSGQRRSLTSIGWQHDVDSLSARLQLPPGWRVFTVTGVDKAYNTWTASWRVWDLFIVLILVVAVVRLRGLVAGLICALTLALIYPEAPAFLYLWLNLIAVMALLSLLPEGRLHRLSRFYAGASALVLGFWLLSFMVDQARLGLYPQLQQPWVQLGQDYSYRSTDVATPTAAPAMESLASSADMMEKARSVDAVRSALPSPVAKPALPPLQRTDPNLAAQTGPGRPNWQWMQTELRWSGPVTQGEQFKVVLMSPWQNRLLAWLRIALGLLMLLAVLGLHRQKGQWTLRPLRTRVAQPAALLLALVLGGGLTVPDAQAGLPDPAMLQELKQRLLKAPDCTPACLGIERLQIDISGQRLSLRFSAHSREALYWPLPDSQQQWRIDGVLLDGRAHSLRKPEQATANLQLPLPAGSHDLQLSGTIGSGPFQLTFPVQPHNLVINAPDWDVRGLDNGRLQGSGLYFEPRQRDTAHAQVAEEKQLQPDPVPAFVIVERQLRLGLDWYVETRVQRVAPQQGGITLDIPLLSGESVTTQGVDITDGLARVQLKPGVNSLTWQSTLAKTDTLQLHSDSSGHWAEHWQLDPSPLWHISADGIPPLKESGAPAQWRPRWRPYPGEQLTLQIQRPDAMAGATSTIDQIHHRITPGQREVQHHLRLQLVNSKGSEQRIELPPDVRVKQVLVNGDARAVEEDNPRVTVALNPGRHTLEIEWRETAELASRITTPVLHLNGDYVNHSIQLDVPQGRWVLLAGGPPAGPAVLFWGVLIVTLIVALGLGRLRQLPLKTWHWILLVLGLCTGWIQLLLLLALWFFLMQRRSQLDLERLTRRQFNLMQLGLAALSLFTFLALLATIPNGLLGTPDMGVVGNGSNHHQLNWFVDRGQDALAQAWLISIPLWIYRVLMLVWSLWLALKLMDWLKWGWQAFTQGGYWRNDVVQAADKQ